MRLGAPIYGPVDTPGQWAQTVKKHGYGAAYCPDMVMRKPNDEPLIREFVEVAKHENIVIAEVGAWSNPISRDDNERAKAIKMNQDRLALAERVGARCCVNIAGSRGKNWCGPDPANLSPETFDIIVQTVRGIIDAVKPTRTFYTLEAMPWAWPENPDEYLALIKAIDRKAFAVHLDPVNFVNSPRRYYDNAKLLRDCFAKLGPYIRSCHGKDIKLKDNLVSTQFDEVRPGAGAMDYTVYLQELSKLEPDVPLMLEHLPSEQEYKLAADYVRETAKKAGVSFVQ